MERALLTRRRSLPLPSAAGAAALLLFAALLALQMDLVFSIDDFFYAAYWREGLSGFLAKNAEHYQTVNGRTLVHAVAESVLAFGSRELCGAVGTAVLLCAVLLARRAMGAEKLAGPLAFSLPLAALLPLLSPETLRETLLWTSAFYNYAFPMVLLMGQLWALEGWLELGGWRRGAVCALLCLLAGATTELYGAMALILACGMALVRLFRTRAGWYRVFPAPVCTALGLYTVLLSPATRQRMESELVATGEALAETAGSRPDLWEQYLSRLEGMAEVLFGPAGSGALALTILFAAACLLGLLKKERRPLILWGAAAAALWLIPGTMDRFWFAAAAAAALAVTLLIMRGLEGAGVLLAAGGCAVLAICLTGSVAPRTAFPFLFSAGLAACRLWAELLAGVEERADERPGSEHLPAACGAAVFLLTAVVLTAYLPTRQGVADNAALDRVNWAAAGEAARTGGDFRYDVDYDRRYCHTGIYEFAPAYRAYLDYWGLKSGQVWFTSDVIPYVTVDGRRIRTLSGGRPKEDGTLGQLPVGEVFAALGGRAEWRDGTLWMELDGRSCRWEKPRYQFTDQWGDPVEYVAYADGGSAFSLLPHEVLDIVFGIRTEYDAGANCYRLTYEPERGAAIGLSRDQ